MHMIGTAMDDSTLFLDTGFTQPLDAVCGMKVVSISGHVGGLSLLLANARG